MIEEVEDILNILESRLADISSYKILDRKILFNTGDVAGSPEKPDFDDSSWNITGPPLTWNNSADVWFRDKIVVPEQINGIDLKGSGLEISGSNYFTGVVVFGHGELFIDGVKIFESRNWTDFRFRNSLSLSVTQGESHIIAIHFYKRDYYVDEYPRSLDPLELHYSKIDEIIFEVATFIEEIKFSGFLSGGNRILEDVFNKLKLHELRTVDFCELISIINSIREKLKDLSALAKEYTVKLVGHAHIDINWLWPMDETEDVCRDTFSTVLKLMEKFPDLHFSQSQAQLYKIIEDKYPNLFEEITKKVKEGNWEVLASSWVESDLNMLNGESIVRQILYARRYTKEKFGVVSEIFWVPDTFGHPLSMPQILLKSGIKYYYFMRGSLKEDDLFWWEGINGSKVLVFNSRYNGKIDVKDICVLAKLTDRNKNNKMSIYLYGIGDHGGGPTAKDIETAAKINSKALMPKLELSTAHSYFKTISNCDINIPVRKVEFNPVFDGSYTTHWDIKVSNRNCEKLLIETETADAIARTLECKNGDMGELCLADAWKATLFNQFHDILPGSGIKPSYDYSIPLGRQTQKKLMDILHINIGCISERIKLKDRGVPLLVFNSLSWERSEIVSIDIPDNSIKYVAKDCDGNFCPSQHIGNKLLFLAEKIPAVGYKMFYLAECPNEYPTFDYPLTVIPFTMENEFFILEIDKNTGTISYLYDKRHNKTVMKMRRDEGAWSDDAFPQRTHIKDSSNESPITGVYLNNLLKVVFEKPHRMSAYVIGPTSKIINLIDNPVVEVISSGPLTGTIRITNRFNKSVIVQDITMHKGSERININTTLEWNEESDMNTEAPMLKASFTPFLNNVKARYEIPYGSVERVTDGREYPALNWVNISDDEYGLSILTDTKYGFDVLGNTVSITLVRTSHEPDPEPDKGIHSFTYSIFPHKNNFFNSGTVNKGYELKHRPIVSIVKDCAGIDGYLPEVKSFIDIKPIDVILTAFKKSEDDNNLILRVYESKGKEVQATVRFGFDIRKIEEVNLMEETLDGKYLVKDGILIFKIKPFEIKTFKLIMNNFIK